MYLNALVVGLRENPNDGTVVQLGKGTAMMLVAGVVENGLRLGMQREGYGAGARRER